MIRSFARGTRPAHHNEDTIVGGLREPFQTGNPCNIASTQSVHRAHMRSYPHAGCGAAARFALPAGSCRCDVLRMRQGGSGKARVEQCVGDGDGLGGAATTWSASWQTGNGVKGPMKTSAKASARLRGMVSAHGFLVASLYTRPSAGGRQISGCQAARPMAHRSPLTSYNALSASTCSRSPPPSAPHLFINTLKQAL